MRFSIQLATAAVLACLAFAPAKADVVRTFDLKWTGISNSAMATGQIVLDLTTIPNPQTTDIESTGGLDSWIKSITVTVSGASAGNGTFSTSAFGRDQWSTGGLTIDFSRQLIGQSGGAGTWGTTTGDFNLINNNPLSPAPSGVDIFTLGANDGNADTMQLTSFAPASIPEPATFALLGTGLVLTGVARRRRQV